MKSKLKNNHCPNCGAPVLTEVCSYCNALTGIDTRYADMEYGVIECKEAYMSFFNVIFPMIFAVSFGGFGIAFPVGIFFSTGELDISVFLIMLSTFGLIGLVAFIIGIKPVIRYCLVKFKGKNIEATVYGYMNDNLTINGIPAQIVKLLVNTDEGPRFILYQLGDIKRPYKVNSKIELRVYNNLFLIPKNKKYYFN